MSTIQVPVNNTYILPLNETRLLSELIDEIIGEATEVIAPVWPLQDYVAVNPYAGISDRSFLDARAFMRVFSDCESLMPIEHYAAEFHKGRFSVSDIESAIENLSAVGIPLSLTASQIGENLRTMGAVGVKLDRPAATPNPNRPIRTIAEYATETTDINWTEAIVEEVSKHCAAHYDQGQSSWSSPYRDLTLYQAWRTVAEYDRNLEIVGLSGFREYVTGLPTTPVAAIVQVLKQLEVPVNFWSKFLLCQAFSIPGWSAWAKFQTHWTDDVGMESNDLTGLLAIRLAYDGALAQAKLLRLKWTSLVHNDAISLKSQWTAPGDDSAIRYALLRASEIGYRNCLLRSFSIASEGQLPVKAVQKLAQMVFCIDVRSERIRRHLESQSRDIETLGFAGFFGMAFEYVTLGSSSGRLQLPVLLKPQFNLLEGFQESDSPQETAVVSKRQQNSSWLSLWKSFQTSAVGCFSYVETTGLFYGLKLLQRALCYKSPTAEAKFDRTSNEDLQKLGPTLRGLNQQGITASHQADMAEGMLRNLGLIKDFAALVVFCGHGCQTENNPLAAGLDCGACGGHSGEPNARFAALLLNQPHIRQALMERGIEIPTNTHFLGALHNTTTDTIELFDVEKLPTAQRSNLQELISGCAMATKQTQSERLPIVASKTLNDLLKRASDWSEVRPEWGLAGNAAFIVAPRSLTKNANLDARSFLHSYDYTLDKEGKVLETIMTAPMIVANWINMQYYASAVDNQHFGSGNKTVHNIVGRFGVLSGNGGDLMTGLPWQSLHTGNFFQHLPMRLQVVIAAPREMIDRIITKHEMVSNLLTGSWLHLIAIEGGKMYGFSENGNWEQLDEVQASKLTEV